MSDVVMPRLSASMEEGTILRWLRSDGDALRAGDELVEIETDKATETYAIDREGVLEVVAAVGETLPVGALIARLDADGTPPAPAAPPPAEGRAPTSAKGETTVVDATRGESQLGRRMAESRATIPDYTVALAVDASAALETCGQLEDRVALGDLVIAACGRALREQPRVNASYRDGRFEQHARVNVGVAVGTAFPTIFDADVKTAAAIATETAALAERAGSGALTSPELAGATFTVSTLAVTRFAPIIVPPHAAALAAGAPARRGRGRSVMELTLACDHRIVFPADAERFLTRVRELLERPAALLVPATDD
jgi:pyruvate dehydrogenase E2 component (dihydrolipoamide acetyltransferase)